MIATSAIVISNNARSMDADAVLILLAVLVAALAVWLCMYIWDRWR